LSPLALEAATVYGGAARDHVTDVGDLFARASPVAPLKRCILWINI
jgi:hypothetical protein